MYRVRSLKRGLLRRESMAVRRVRARGDGRGRRCCVSPAKKLLEKNTKFIF
jgi:hypothetical protein